MRIDYKLKPLTQAQIKKLAKDGQRDTKRALKKLLEVTRAATKPSKSKTRY